MASTNAPQSMGDKQVTVLAGPQSEPPSQGHLGILPACLTRQSFHYLLGPLAFPFPCLGPISRLATLEAVA